MPKTKKTKRPTPALPTGVPLPGRPVKGSQSGRPIMATLSLLSRRWILRIIWELREEACGFRELQARCDRMSPDTLSTRLGELQEAGIVEHDAAGDWALTELGQAMESALTALHEWSDLWAEVVQKNSKGK